MANEYQSGVKDTLSPHAHSHVCANTQHTQIAHCLKKVGLLMSD